MSTDGRRHALGALLIVALVACDLDFPPSSARRVVVTNLSITGVVTSSATGNPIAQATVDLGQGGNFSFPTVKNFRITDAQGRYTIDHQLEHFEGECGFTWIRASASGFQTSNIESSALRVQCITAQQAINVALAPAP